MVAEGKMVVLAPSAEETGQQPSRPLAVLIWLLSGASEGWILGGKASCGKRSHVGEGSEVRCFHGDPEKMAASPAWAEGSRAMGCCAQDPAAPKHTQRQQTPGAIPGKHN